MVHDSTLNMFEVLDKHLIPKAPSGDSKVFYQQNKADNYRNIVDFSYGDAEGEAAENGFQICDSFLEMLD